MLRKPRFSMSLAVIWITGDAVSICACGISEPVTTIFSRFWASSLFLSLASWAIAALDHSAGMTSVAQMAVAKMLFFITYSTKLLRRHGADNARAAQVSHHTAVAFPVSAAARNTNAPKCYCHLRLSPNVAMRANIVQILLSGKFLRNAAFPAQAISAITKLNQ